MIIHPTFRSNLDYVLEYLIKDVNKLYNEGLEIDGGTYFEFIGLSRDNLGQHINLGFAVFCKDSRDSCRKIIKEKYLYSKDCSKLSERFRN